MNVFSGAHAFPKCDSDLLFSLKVIELLNEQLPWTMFAL